MLDAEQIEPDRLRPLMRAEYDRLVDLGVFEDERVELLRGALVTMSPQGVPHADAVEWLTEALIRSLAGRARVRCQLPLAIADDSAPEPDLAVVPGPHVRGVPATWAHLVVEVAHSSLRKDREVKRDIYAEAGVPEYWIVNVAERVVEVYRAPQDGRYTTREQVGVDARLRLVEFPDVEIAVAELF